MRIVYKNEVREVYSVSKNNTDDPSIFDIQIKGIEYEEHISATKFETEYIFNNLYHGGFVDLNTVSKYVNR